MNIINKTSIEWTKSADGKKGYVWNPAHGCNYNCNFCFARKYDRRFYRGLARREVNFLNSITNKKYRYNKKQQAQYEKLCNNIKSFHPTWLRHRYFKKFPKKPSTIFVNSMSDCRYWQVNWWREVLNKIYMHPQHTFIFLTKFPVIYSRIGQYFTIPDNCQLGVSVTGTGALVSKMYKDLSVMKKHTRIISFEPLHAEPLPIVEGWVDQVIIGAETGLRKGKIIPERAWIKSIVSQCVEFDIPVFMKDNLRDIWGGELTQEWRK